MKTVCVYCGSSFGNNPVYSEVARELGQTLAERQIELIYGGGRVGLMGVVADAVLAAGGRVQGVIPQALADREVAHHGLTQLHIVQSMHDRKSMMADLSEGFIALPGGIGTLEELFEIWTWAQLGIHSRPIGLLNIAGYFDRLLEFLTHAMREAFLKPAHHQAAVVSASVADLLEQMQQSPPVNVGKWLDQDQR
ncbi:MAG: TIGR00730 family Rossman fold protein [Planctomycetota bacterium]|nr:MAG: TIGR00730 family Rossman fold protein [Planctomycetota bacterium]